MKEINIKLTPIEAAHILTLIRENNRDGWHYGNREQYFKRAQKIFDKIEEAINEKPNG